MEKRIELERRARKAHQITELNLDNCRSTSIVGLTDEYTALESLSLINVGLTTLKGFPKLPNLKKLELSDNRIPNGLNYLHTSPKLQYLNLSGNKIKDLEALKPLKEFKHLTILDLFNNEATQTENYRGKIFEMLPSLKFLDGFDCNDAEAPSDADEDDEIRYSDEYDGRQNAFCLNGLEFDLDELEEFEKRVKAKREAKLIQEDNNTILTSSSLQNQIICNTNSSDSTVNADVDELDEYLKTLKLREQQNEQEQISTTQTGTTSNCSNMGTSANFALLLYWFLAILNLASATFSNQQSDDFDSDLSSDECSTDDVSLSEVYNDELEEDDSEWDEENAADYNDDQDEDGDEDEHEDEAINAAVDTGADADANAEETQARGKKRKHEG